VLIRYFLTATLCLPAGILLGCTTTAIKQQEQVNHTAGIQIASPDIPKQRSATSSKPTNTVSTKSDQSIPNTKINDHPAYALEFVSRVFPQSNIDEQLKAVNMINNADLVAIENALANFPTDFADGQHSEWTAGLIMQRWIELDSQAALEELKLYLGVSSSAKIQYRFRLQVPVISQWIADQPSKAMQWLHARDSNDRKALVHELAGLLPLHNLRGSMRLYADSDENTKKLMAANIAEQLYQQNSEAAWDWYRNLDEEKPRQIALTTLLMATANDDPYLALSQSEKGAAGMAIYDMRNPLRGMLEYLTLYNKDVVQQWLSAAELDNEDRTFIESRLHDINNRRGPAPHMPSFFPPTRPHSPE